MEVRNSADPGETRRVAQKGGRLLGSGSSRRPSNGKLREIMRTVDRGDASGAYRFLQEELAKIESGEGQSSAERIRFSEYAASLFERKVTKGKIKSAKTREKWEGVLRRHLIPAFGDYFLDGLRRRDIEAWLERMGQEVQANRYSPRTVNGWLDLLRVIITSAVSEYELPRNPVAGIEDIDTSTHFTYSEEQPNSLLVEEVPVFLAGIRRLFPQHFAFVALGFATGLRPSSLRPLRRRGPEADVLWDQGVVLVRRSHTRRDEVMEATKQKTRYRITLPDDLMAILRWHVDRLPPGPMRDSDSPVPVRDGRVPSGVSPGQAFQAGRRGGQAEEASHLPGDAADLPGPGPERRHRSHRPSEDSAATPRRRCPTFTAPSRSGRSRRLSERSSRSRSTAS